MKKIIALLLALCLTAGLMTACSSPNSDSFDDASQNSDSLSSGDDASQEKIEIVTTIFPIYDWVKSILGDENENVELTLLLDTGVDMHSYEPTTSDMIKILECDLFIYVGGESDTWVDGTLANATNEDMKVISLFDILGDTVKEEESVEGMEEHDHDHDEDEECTDEDHDHDEDEECTDEDDEDEECTDEDHDHDEDEECTDDCCDEEAEDDEHVWLSLINAETICNAITELLNEIDQDNSSVYTENNENYIAQLQELDAKYQEVVANANQSTLLFGDRFPFRYLVDDYDISYYAAFPGCSAETEASFETITFLAGKLDELELSTVLIIDGSDGSIANTIIASTTAQTQQVLVLDSMQSISASDIDAGTTYLSIMESNLEIITEALS